MMARAADCNNPEGDTTPVHVFYISRSSSPVDGTGGERGREWKGDIGINPKDAIVWNGIDIDGGFLKRCNRVKTAFLFLIT